MSRDLAIDLGTANTLVYQQGRGIVLNEPSVIAVNTKTNQVLAIGHQAWEMIGRTPGYIVALRPLRSGAITDFDITEKMIELLLQKVGVGRFNKPRVVICVPSVITEVERRAVEEATKKAGASEVYLVEQPMAAAIGAGLPVSEPIGSMIIDIGGGTTETAIISLGGIVTIEAIRVGGFEIDNAVQSYIRKEYGITIGERTAEDIKIAIGSASSNSKPIRAEVRGRDILSGLPRVIEISRREVNFAIEDQVQNMVDAVKTCLANSPPDLGQDLISEGIFLTGGGGLLDGMAERLAFETMLPIQIVDNPLECVVLGAGEFLKSLDDLKRYISSKKR